MIDKKNRFAHIIALLSLVGLSFSAPLGKLAIDIGAAPISVGIWRMVFSVPIMAAFWLISHSRKKIKLKKEVDIKTKLVSILSGVFLGFHFICWYIALQKTSVFNASVLVCLQPIYALIGTYLIYKQKPSSSIILPLIVALIGSIVLLLPSIGKAEPTSLLGNILATLSGLFMAAYLMCGKFSLKNISLGGYTTITYGLCLVVMTNAALIFNVPIAINTQALIICLILAVASTVFGHTIINWSLPHVGALFAAIVLLGEPVGASIVAYFMFKTVPNIIEILGGILIIFGIVIFILRANKKTKQI